MAAPKKAAVPTPGPWKSVGQCTEDEKTRYESAYLASWRTLSFAIEALSIALDDPNLGLIERLGMKTEVRRLQKEQEILDLFEEAFFQNRSTIMPPDAATVKQARSYTDQVQSLVNNAMAAGRAIQVAQQAVELFRRLNSA